MTCRQDFARTSRQLKLHPFLSKSVGRAPPAGSRHVMHSCAGYRGTQDPARSKAKDLGLPRSCHLWIVFPKEIKGSRVILTLASTHNRFSHDFLSTASHAEAPPTHSHPGGGAGFRQSKLWEGGAGKPQPTCPLPVKEQLPGAAF